MILMFLIEKFWKNNFFEKAILKLQIYFKELILFKQVENYKSKKIKNKIKVHIKMGKKDKVLSE